ncbi:hypothetical protein L596_008812 [Steinernema carpocapsae]|uniref:Translocon-associated protein subunit alpha n=1 Tax=Steinernema carpocapsae TaxID=34508 RepID=A0A4U5PEE0_STECR|nr:hypothetical protein L596_008812 [Steinernema carpocapsae]
MVLARESFAAFGTVSTCESSLRCRPPASKVDDAHAAAISRASVLQLAISRSAFRIDIITAMKLRSLLFAFLLLSVGAFADDAVDGEVQDEQLAEQVVEDLLKVSASPDVETSFLMTQPEEGYDLTAGQIVKFLIGFHNKGDKEFIVRFSDTSFRYPMDYSYHVQNFTAARYDRVVGPKQEATFDYAFVPNEAFASRPFGLVVNVHYEDKEGQIYTNNVFNQTVNILEDESGFNTETGFLVIIFVGFLAGAAFLSQGFLSKFTRKSGIKKRAVVETGTSGKKGEVDFEWIPRQALNHNDKKSPKPGSPRVKKNN